MKPALKRYVRPIVKGVRYAANEARDVLDGVRGNRHPLVPPRNRIFTGAGPYCEIGEEFFGYFKNYGNLRPTERVLDVGCGLGRMAIALTTYLQPPGQYDGFDIVPAGIEWCQQRFTPRHPNFQFVLADVYNAYYNPTGRVPPSEYRFPYPDATFDFVFLTSVFTHMMTSEVENYLAEIARVMRPAARCLITFFLLNNESRSLMLGPRSAVNFAHGTGECRYAVPENPELVVAFDEAFVRETFARNGFVITPPIRYGSWCGRREHLSYQDIVIATRH
jgi:SAM-dependent methyltransferase